MREAGALQELLVRGIVGLGDDMKEFLSVIDDPDRQPSSRASAAGGLMHVLGSANVFPGAHGMLVWVDDAVLLRWVAQQIASQEGLAAQALFPSTTFGSDLDHQIALLKDALGPGAALVEKVSGSLPAVVHHGHSAQDCATKNSESTWLYEEVQQAVVDRFDFDEDEVRQELKTGLQDLFHQLAMQG